VFFRTAQGKKDKRGGVGDTDAQWKRGAVPSSVPPSREREKESSQTRAGLFLESDLTIQGLRANIKHAKPARRNGGFYYLGLLGGQGEKRW